MPTTDPAPPIRDLPEEIEAALEAHQLAVYMYTQRPWHPDEKAKYAETEESLRHAIRAALDERQQKSLDMVRATTGVLEAINERTDDRRSEIVALRERCERLRRVADVASLCGTTPDIVLEALADLHEDDYADDLRPRGGDER